MNTQNIHEVQKSYAEQTHQRMLDDAAHKRLLRDLDGRSSQKRAGLGGKTKALLVVVIATLIPVAGWVAANAGDFSNSARKFLVY